MFHPTRTLFGLYGFTWIASAAASSAYSYTSFHNIIQCEAPNGLFTPTSVGDVISIVNQAAAANQSVRVVTPNKWSITDVLCSDPTNGLVVSLENFKDLTYNEHEKTVTVGSGWQVQKLAETIGKQFNVSFIHLPSFGSITVGGAVATGAHGSSLKHIPSLSDNLVGVRVVQADGTLRNITDEATLRHYKVNLGVLGVVTHFTFPVVPLFKVQWTTTPYDERVLTNGTLLDIAKKSDGVYAYWNPNSKSVVAAVMKYVDISTPGDDYWNYIPNVEQHYRFIQKGVYELAQSTGFTSALCGSENLLHNRLTTNFGIYQLIAPYFENAASKKTSGSSFAGGLSSTGLSYNMLSSFCDNCPFNQPQAIYFNDFGVDMPIRHMNDAISFTQDIISRLPVCFPLSDILIRFIKASDADLISPTNDDYVSIEWDTTHRNNPFKDPELDLGWVGWVSQGYFLNFKAKSHWGKTGNFPHYANDVGLPEAVDLYPELPGFTKYQETTDPKGMFLNDFYRASILGNATARAMKTYPKCALTYDCVCSTDDHCAEGQKCVNAPLPGDKWAKICLKDKNAGLLGAGLLGNVEALLRDFKRYF